MKIEKMNLSHVPAVHKIFLECLSDPWSEDALCEEVQNPSSLYFVAMTGEDVIGFGGVKIIAGEAYITNIAVSGKHRRCGVGSKILKEIINCCSAESCTFVTLEVRVSNSVATKMYEKAGFVSQGIRRAFYSHPTEDANIMTLFLKDLN